MLCSLNLLHGKQKENEATKSAALLLDLVPQYPASRGYSLACLQHLQAFKPFASHVSYLVGLFTPQEKYFCQCVNKPSTQLTFDTNDLL